MLKQVIRGYHAVPGAPKNWDPSHGSCGGLPIRLLIDGKGQLYGCESAWLPTATELEQLNAGGTVVLRVVGMQPPVSLYVEPRETDDGL